MLLKASAIKDRIKEAGKRSSKDFIAAFNQHVEKELDKAIAEHNAGKKTIDASVVKFLWQ